MKILVVDDGFVWPHYDDVIKALTAQTELVEYTPRMVILNPDDARRFKGLRPIRYNFISNYLLKYEIQSIRKRTRRKAYGRLRTPRLYRSY
jgi:hypothetical protein